jgi:hypothetical protein
VIFELREYVAAPGAAQRLHDRFATHTLGLFSRHGLEVVGYWTDREDESRIIYLLRFADEAARTAAWDAFQKDPEWKRVRAASEADGPIVAEMHSRVLASPDYWTRTTVSA